MHTRFDYLPWLTILATALLLCGCSAGVPYFQPTAPPTPTYYIWNPSVTPTHPPTTTPTATPSPTFTPTPSPTPADLPLLSDGQHIFRILSAGARNDWEIYGEYFQRLSAREGQVFFVVEVELTSGTNPLDLLLGQGALGRVLYLSDERQQLYPAVQVLRSEDRAFFVFQGLPVSYSGSLQLHFLNLSPTTFIPGLDFSIIRQQAAPHALATSLALPQPAPLALNCAQPVDLTILPALSAEGMSQVPAGKTFRVQLAPPGQGGAVPVDHSASVGLLRVDTRMVQGRSGSTGLIFGVNDMDQNGYALLVDTSGRWAFSMAGFNGDWKMLRDFSPSPAVQPGAATNRLTVVRQNGMIALYANDIPLTSAFPLGITGSGDGLGIRSPGSETLIDEFSRYQRCQLPTNSPLPIQLGGDPPGQWPAETPLLLEYTWSANTLAQAEQFAARASIRLQVDGITAANPQKNWGRAAPLGGIFSSGERSVIRWQAQINPLPPGRHHILFRLSLLQPVTSGLDRDADGKFESYGPGLIVNQDFDLEVK